MQFVAVKQGQNLTCLGKPHVDPVFDMVAVKGMGRLTGGQHDIVGHVH